MFKAEKTCNNDYAGKNGYPEGHVPITTFMAVPVFDGNRITAIGAVANKNSGYEMSDVRSLISLYEKLWEILRRKESETSLRESNERFKALHNASFGGITIHDKGIIFECNQGLADMTGYTSDELIGMDGLLLIAEKSRGLVMENILSGYEKPYEAFGLRKNGEEFPMRLEARNVPYKGEMVRTVEFRDITDIKKSEENLLKRLSYENMVAGISSLSLSEFNIDRFMSAVIDNLGETTRSSRAYIFEYRQDDFTINNTFEWCAPGITPQIDELQNIPADTITWWIDTLKRGENIRFEDIEDIPDEAAKEMLRPQGILSILVIPVFVDKKFYGFIGLDDCLNRNLWAEEDVVILESVTRIISGYMESRNSRLMLKEKAVLLKNITDNMLDLVALTDLKGNFKFAGKSHNILGYEPDYLIGRNVMEFVHPEDSVHVAEGFAGWLEGKEESARAEYRYRREDGTYIWLETVGRLIRDDEENVREIVFSSRDVTEKKKTEAELRKLSVALNQSPSCIVITGTDGTIEYVNPKFEELTGYSIDEAVGRNPSMLQSGSTPDVVYRELWDTINSGEVWRGNFQNRKKNGEKYWEFATIAPILNQQGETINFMAIKEDITERKKAEERISTLLQGKELLLKESHHRVKNNMNTVYGMLYMQAEELEEQKSRSIIKDAAWRVQSMMLLYDKLYQSESINELNIKDYIPPLIEEIAGIFDPRVQVKRKIIVDDIVLNAKTISALGIIINELITNSMKYAFNNVSDGLIYLEVAQKDNEVTVIYHDNGPGLPESFSFDDSEGFGMQLINMLVRQINGTIEVEKGESGRIIIRFRN
jgi:PAS domain S-box-containing protein